MAISAPTSAWIHGNAASNASSSVGANLAPIGAFRTAQPFANLMLNINVFGLNGAAVDPLELCLDVNGWPTTLTNLQTAPYTGALPTPPGSCTQGTAALTGWTTPPINNTFPAPYYPGGTYHINWVGSCTLSVGGDASGYSTSGPTSGTGTFTATPSSTGFTVALSAMGSGNNTTTGYCRNVSVVRDALQSAYLAGCGAGIADSSCFDPNYIAFHKYVGFRSARFMDWMCTNRQGSYTAQYYTEATWPGRPAFGLAFYVSDHTEALPCGVPVELMVAWANATNEDMWVNMPTLSDSTYWTSFATYVAAHLNSNLYAYVEYSNETWNGGFSQAYPGMSIVGSLYPSLYIQGASPIIDGCWNTSSQQCNRSVMAGQTNLICDAWKTAFTGAAGDGVNRVKCVMPGQSADTTSISDAMSCVIWIGDYVVSAGTYNSGTGAMTLTTTAAHGLTNGSAFSFAALAGTGAFASLAGSQTAGAGTTGTNISFTFVPLAGGLPAASTITGGGVGVHHCNHTNLDYIAHAPYFGTSGGTAGSAQCCNAWGGSAPVETAAFPDGQVKNSFSPTASWLTDGSGGLNSLFTNTITGGVCTGYYCDFYQGTGKSALFLSHTWQVNYQTPVATYGYPALSYEGGWAYDAFQGYTSFGTLFISAKSDSRAGTNYTNYFNTWRSDAGQLFNQYYDMDNESNAFQWGMEPNLCGTGGSCTYTWTRPETLAIKAWIQANPCNWVTAKGQPCRH